jgi:hypothetical protein
MPDQKNDFVDWPGACEAQEVVSCASHGQAADYMSDILHFAAIPIGIINYNFSVINYIFS